MRLSLKRILDKKHPEKSSKVVTYSFQRQGNFTICLLNNQIAGVSKRNPNCDGDDPERGEDIAFSEALKNMGNYMLPQKAPKRAAARKAETKRKTLQKKERAAQKAAVKPKRKVKRG